MHLFGISAWIIDSHARQSRVSKQFIILKKTLGGKTKGIEPIWLIRYLEFRLRQIEPIGELYIERHRAYFECKMGQNNWRQVEPILS